MDSISRLADWRKQTGWFIYSEAHSPDEQSKHRLGNVTALNAQRQRRWDGTTHLKKSILTTLILKRPEQMIAIRQYMHFVFVYICFLAKSCTKEYMTCLCHAYSYFLMIWVYWASESIYENDFLSLNVPTKCKYFTKELKEGEDDKRRVGIDPGWMTSIFVDQH